MQLSNPIQSIPIIITIQHVIQWILCLTLSVLLLQLTQYYLPIVKVHKSHDLLVRVSLQFLHPSNQRRQTKNFINIPQYSTILQFSSCRVKVAKFNLYTVQSKQQRNISAIVFLSLHRPQSDSSHRTEDLKVVWNCVEKCGYILDLYGAVQI